MTVEKPLRKDAERNRELILEAARELFAQRGLGVTLNDIAHHAGVGVGTVYRRFPDREVLIEALFEQRLADVVALARAASENPDAWDGFKGFLEGSLELQARDRGLKELVLASSAGGGLKRVHAFRSQIMPIASELVERAQRDGRLRDDVAVTDFPLVQVMLGAIIDVTRDVDPDVWRRYLALWLHGLEAPARGPLPAGPLAPEQVDVAMSSWEPPRR